MSKNILFIIIISFSINLFAQTNERVELSGSNFLLKIENEEIDYSQVKKGEFWIYDYLGFTDPSNSGTYKLPSKTILIALPAYSKPEISVISFDEKIHSKTIPQLNPVLKKINDSTIVEDYSDLSYKTQQGISNKIIEILGYGWYRNYYCAQIKINTHHFNETNNSIIERKNILLKVNLEGIWNSAIQLSKLNDDLEKDIIYNYEIAGQFNSEPVFNITDSTGNWINYNSEYLKIGTVQNGLFRISKSDLESMGVMVSGINPRTFQLFETGDEIPIFVSGESDGSFDDQDYIEFYGTMNYSRNDHRVINDSGEEYNEFLNRYSDTTFYFLTWSVVEGKRIPVVSFTASVNDTLNYYKSFEHIENNRVYFAANNNELENQYPNWNKNKTWYYSQTVWLYSNTTRSYTFNAPDAVPNRQAKFYFKAVSGGSNVSVNSHNVAMRVNNELIDSMVVNRYDQVLLNGSLSTNLLSESGNTLSVRNYSNGTNPNFLSIDWYEIEYARKIKLNNDVIHFTVDDDVINSVKVVKVENALSAQYDIYKIKPFYKKITNAQLADNVLTFTDTITAGDVYIISTPAKTTKPFLYYKKQFLNIRNVSRQVDYLAVIHPDFLAVSNSYLSSIESFYNIKTESVDVYDIFDEFGYGYPNPEAIKNYLAVTFTNRQSPKPDYLTIIGDGNYDYKDYFFKATGVKGGRNYIPSFGNPVSDNWFVIWNDSSVLIPQMKVGRIPINNADELNYYLSKIENNFTARFDEFNKRYLFFSGGVATDTLELFQLRTTNEYVINNYIKPAPVKGAYTHFYKTYDPITDFGPYSAEEISSAIKDGGVFISYLGHSGTATWDNSISETDQLMNEVNRNPLITDFGCSTNRFGEPDIVSFGERFLLRNTGQAIGYIGNSSLGFTSTAYTVPRYFYESIVNSELKEIGNAFLQAKIKMFQNLGSSTSYRIFALTNTLIGDPVIRIGIPSKPNLKIALSDINLSKAYPTDALDSLRIKISVNNFGLVEADSFTVSVSHKFNSQNLSTISYRILLPDFKDSLIVHLPVKNKPGLHNLEVKLDIDSEIDEIYEDDNETIAEIIVFSNEVRDLLINRIENSQLSSVSLLNPFVLDENNLSFMAQISDDEAFSNPNTITANPDTFFTKMNLGTLELNKRYYFRYKLDVPGSEFSLPKSFLNVAGDEFLIKDSIAFAEQTSSNLEFNNGLKISNTIENISVTSAGFYAGASCVIAKNGINLLSNTFFAGMGIVVFNPVTLEIDTTAWFNLFNNPTNMAALVNLINSIPDGKIVAMGVADDAANNISQSLKDAIKTLGSTRIDNLAFRGSWALIGKKGAEPGEVLEMVKGPYAGIIYIDSSFVLPNFSGTMETRIVGPVQKWNSFSGNYNTPNNADIEFMIIGLTDSQLSDTLISFNSSITELDLSNINSKTYPFIKIIAQLNADSNGNSPEINQLSLSYTALPELGVNNQTVHLESDTVFIGDLADLKIKISNAGENKADSVRVLVLMINENSSIDTVRNDLIQTINPESYVNMDFSYQTTGADRNKTFVVNVDPESKIRELYKDNNIFTQELTIIPDSTSPTLKIKFDGDDILEGDYISKTPVIRIEVSDESNIPFSDTSQVSVYLNEEKITSSISYQFSSDNPKLIATYTPSLESGDYLLRVTARDPGGNFADSISGLKFFRVSGEMQILQVFNYPNPFTENTNFTFKLTQIPEEIKIRIFTIAGRLIKEIAIPSAELKYDFNQISWDGRDEDGDLIANGTYLYKVIMNNQDKTESVTQKLSVVR